MIILSYTSKENSFPLYLFIMYREKELDLIISNAEYRRQLLETTRGIDHLRSLIGSIANMIKTYKGISQQVRNCDGYK